MDNPPENVWHALREILRFALQLVTAAFGIYVAVLSQVSSPNYKVLFAVVSNNLIFYLMLVAFQLWIFRMRGWKVLLAVTLIVCAFVAELFIRVSAG